MRLKISHDYDEFLREVHEDLAGGVLTEDDNVQILRGETLHSTVSTRTEISAYQPIINWYYDNEEMENMIGDTEDGKEIAEQYFKDKPDLEVISVDAFVEEMERMNEIV